MQSPLLSLPDDLLSYLFGPLETVTMCILRHTCKKIRFVIPPPSATDIVCDSIMKNTITVTDWLVKSGYQLDDLTAHAAITKCNFDVLNRYLANSNNTLTSNHLLTSIKSKNKSMVTFVRKRIANFEERVNDYIQIFITEMAAIDNVEIFLMLVPNTLQNIPDTLDKLILNNSVKIIENIRFRLSGRTAYERIVYARSIELKNLSMIQYCEENDYGRGPI